MVRALRTMDRHPYAYSAELTKDGKPEWPLYLAPESILVRYIESGIPVILGIRPWQSDQRDCHAVVAVGTTFQKRQGLTFNGANPNISEYVPYFLVNDDQRGINLRMPVVSGSVEEETPYNVRDHVFFILVPLPDKVFVTAESAERKAWDHLHAFYNTEWQGLKVDHAASIGASILLGDKVAVALTQNAVVARTYLTMGWTHKRHVIKSQIGSAVQALVMVHDLPRFVWVTEFGLADDVNHIDPKDRRIFGHCVHDATAAADFAPPLMFHVPGFMWLWSQEIPSFYVSTKRMVYPIMDDGLYAPRHRPKRS